MNALKAIDIIEGTGGEEATCEQILEAWQFLVDTGLAWQLQGIYGRLAQELIDGGLIVLRSNHEG